VSIHGGKGVTGAGGLTGDESSDSPPPQTTNRDNAVITDLWHLVMVIVRVDDGIDNRLKKTKNKRIGQRLTGTTSAALKIHSDTQTECRSCQLHYQWIMAGQTTVSRYRGQIMSGWSISMGFYIPVFLDSHIL